MSATQHETAARAEEKSAEQATLQPAAIRGVGWTSVIRPNESESREADRHRVRAADHRRGSEALRNAEASACDGLSSDDRAISPFEHLEDIEGVVPLNEKHFGGKQSYETTAGASVRFRAVPGMTPEWLQRLVDCHLARNAALGHTVPEMPDCPLVPKGTTAKVSSAGNGLTVAIRSDDSTAAQEILARAQRLASKVK